MLPSSKFGGTYPPQGFLLCKNPCGAGCDGGRGSSSQSTRSPRKEISRGNLLCTESGLTNLSYPRLQSVQKYVARPTGTTVCIGQPGVPEGPLPLCFGRSPEETLPKGFLWAISSRRLDTALLCAAKKRGVELDQLEGLCLKYSGHTWPRQNARRGSQGHQPLFHQLLQAH